MTVDRGWDQPESESARSDVDRRRWVWTGAVVVAGVALGIVEGIHVLRMIPLVGPVGVLLESVLPLALSGVLVAIGGWLHRSDYATRELRRIVGWIAVGSVAVGLLFAWSLSHQYIAGGTFPHARFVMGTNLIVGTLLGTVVGLYDVRTRRHRRAAERERRTVERQRTKLAFLNRELRHHVLNGMNVVQGQLDRARRGDGELDGVEDRVADVVDTVQRVGTITRALDPRAEVQLEPRDLSATVREEVDRLRRMTTADVAVDIADDAHDARVLADDLLPGVVANLLHNAVEHNDADQPRVEVSVAVEGGAAELRVADDGPGIDDTHRTVLEAWPETPPDHVDSGVGIGFAIVGTAVDRYGADLAIEDRDPGGTTVTLSLPLAAADGAVDRSASPATVD